MKRLGTILVVGAVAVAAFAPASAPANQGKSKAAHHFTGVLTAISTTSATFRVLSANRPGDRWIEAHPGNVTVALGENTRFGGPMQLADDATDFRVGDGVRVLAKRNADGTALNAKHVKLVLQAYEGTVAAFVPATSITVTWTEANKLGDDWLAANGNPPTVTASITPATRISREPAGDPAPNDTVHMLARANGATLEAVSIDAAAPAA